MDRFLAMLILLGALVTTILLFLALFAVAPIFCSCVASLMYTLYIFLAYEESMLHNAQEFENRYWTIFAVLLSTAFLFSPDSPLPVGLWSPNIGFLGVAFFGYGMHWWDRHIHRQEISRDVGLRRGSSAAASLVRLAAMGIPIKDQLAKINSCLSDIDQLLIPSTVNNFINQRHVLRKEREIISIFEEAEKKALNHIIAQTKLGLLFYKIKDHRNFGGQHRTQLIELLAVERISSLTVISKVMVLHALQMMKLPANARAEYWVRNIILSTHQDELSELKTLTDAKGDYFSTHKLIFDDIRSETVRHDILTHIRKEANVQQAHMAMGTRKSVLRKKKAWRKVLSDVDDTLTCSGGSYPAGIDKRYGKKVVYPGVLGFYRELDLGAQGPESWPENAVGNLVFLSARPHLYKDVSEKQNFAKFEKLRLRSGADGRGGMHTVPSLLAGDVASGRDYIVKNDFEPLAVKKFENFKKYVSIYPEFKHVFVCDNGQGDVRAGEMMFDAFPQSVEALYVHVVQNVKKTHGYDPERFLKKGIKPKFFSTYPEAALDAATRKPPLIRVVGLRRVCQDAVNDFYMIQTRQWPSQNLKWDRKEELNQAIWRANDFLETSGMETVPYIEAERLWKDGEKVRTPFGIGIVRSFDAVFDMYEVGLDWRPLDVQVAEHKKNEEKKVKSQSDTTKGQTSASLESGPAALAVLESGPVALAVLETVVETAEEVDEETTADAHPVARAKDCFLNEDVAAKGSLRSGVLDIAAPEQDHDNEWIKISPTTVPDPKVTGSHEPDAVNLTETRIISSVENAAKETAVILDADDDAGTKESNNEPLNPDDSHFVTAKIHARYISAYSPPKLPVIKDDKKISIFSFWGSGGDATKAKTKLFNVGDKCTTDFGPATVVEYREEKEIVVVEMIGWSARGYLHPKSVKIVSEGLWNSLLRSLAFTDTSDVSPNKKKPPNQKELEFQKGATIDTPYGEGIVVRPVGDPKGVIQKKEQRPSEKCDDTSTNSADAASISSKGSVPKQRKKSTTMAISLKSWKLADGSHPTVYCTLETAQKWKKMKFKSKGGTNILSVVGSLVSKSLMRMGSQPEKKPIPLEISAPRFQRYYKDGAAVTTSFGDGIVQCFRDADGFYEVLLVDWKLANGKHSVAFLQQESLRYRIAKGCHEGYPVLTSLGLSGTLASVEPTTGVHLVTIPAAGMVCYLQPSAVIKPLKAAVNEDVLTPYGEGTVRKYRLRDDVYEITLVGWGAKLFAHGETFDRVDDGMQDRDSPFGIGWFFRIFFSRDDSRTGGSQRSRSNSIVSLGVRSQSGLSGLEIA